MNQQASKTHLEFYREHKIAPVRYDLSDMDAHLERRFSLYAKLGLLPISFKGAKVLEVAAGTGHNSLYVAQLHPAEFTLLEPNESAVEYIHRAYTSFNRPHTKPQVISATVEEYSIQHTFDIVLCENWLGTSQHELGLLRKISEMVAQQGMLVLTTISPIGFVPNLLRRYLSSYLAGSDKSFAERTQLLTAAFASHLKTMAAMTRSPIDWVQDNMINPAYFGLCLSIPLVLEQLNDHFEIVSSSPVIAEDWRWFKSLYGAERQFNQNFLSEYWKKAHNFLDYRERAFVVDQSINLKLEQKAMQLLAAVAHHEELHTHHLGVDAAVKEVQICLDDFISLLPQSLLRARTGLTEVRQLIAQVDAITPEIVANLSDFSGLFGRETVYVSLMRNE